MEFETWDRETLIKETKSAIMMAFSQPTNINTIHPVKFYSDTELNRKTDFELRTLYVQNKKNDPAFHSEYKAYQESKRFFNNAECDADFDYWSKQAYWTIDEAIALILGKDPRKVFWDNLKEYLSVSPFTAKFDELRKLAERYVNSNQLFNSSFPGPFLAWAERMKLDIPNKLREAVNAIGIQVCDWQSLYKDSQELIKSQGKTIELLNKKCELLKSENIRLSETPQFEMDPDHEDYSTELDAANITYRMIVNNRNSQVTFKQQAKSILDKSYPSLTTDAKERIAIVINSDKGKTGGRKPQE